MKTFGVIMAGGEGSRFWPLSRRKTPKQLLNLSGKEIMVNEAIDRLTCVADKRDIFVVTGADQADRMRAATAERIAADHVLVEPAARNTAACIGYAAFKIMKLYGDALMVITPSDAYIADTDAFASVMTAAARAALKSDSLVTVGIKPTFPATGYGYIRYETSDAPAKKVLQFVEKPDKKTAERYLAEGGYVWNSGIFLWKASVILQKFQTFLPDIYASLQTIFDGTDGREEREKFLKIYPTIRSVSVDYGVMEKADNILVVPGDFGWNDVGSWDMLGALHAADGRGNVTVGDTLLLESEGNVVYSSGKLVSLVGVSDMVVVETPDAVLVCPKDRAQEVKKIVDHLRADGREELL